MEVAQQSREDVVSQFLKVSTYKGQTLISPKEIICRKVYSNQEISDVGLSAGGTAGDAATLDSSFTLLNFRALGTSPSAMLGAAVELCVPLWFKFPHCATNDQNGGDALCDWYSGDHGVQSAAESIVCAPRRNALSKAMSSLSCVFNNTASFTSRPDENLNVADALWQEYSELYGPTGCEPVEESGTFGPDTGFIRGVVATAGAKFKKLQVRYPSDGVSQVNKGFIARRAAFLSGITLERADANPVANTGDGGQIKYLARTFLYVPPFRYYNQGTVQPKQPTFLPYADTVELSVHWKSDITAIKRGLIMAAGMGEGYTKKLNSYKLQYAGRPYLNCLYVVPTFQIPPVVTLPCWRTIHYATDVSIPLATSLKDVFNYDASTKVSVTVPPIRIEAMPSLITVHCSSKEISGFDDREYLYPIDQFSLTLNEKLNALSDRDQWDMFKLWRSYSRSKISFEKWRDMRCILAIRGDCLALEASQSIFSPSTLVFKCRIARRIDQLGVLTAQTARLHINFWYTNMAMSVSAQSAAVTDLLLDKSAVSRAGVTASSSVITDIMAKSY
jgi:hypothetical protein